MLDVGNWINGAISKAIRAPRILFVIFLVSNGLLLSAQQADNAKQGREPSLAETEAWITQTFGEGRHVVYRASQEIVFYKSDESDRCDMQFSVIEQVDASPRALQLINLVDVDPSSIQSGQLIHDSEFAANKDQNRVDNLTAAVKDHPYIFVTIKTTDNRNAVISYTYRNENGAPTRYSEMEHSVGVSNLGVAVEPEYAPRFIQALRHAVELCGGKPSTFVQLSPSIPTLREAKLGPKLSLASVRGVAPLNRK
jgi:hypothetical protein